MLTVEWILRIIGIFPHRTGYFYIKDIVELTYDTNVPTLKPLYEKLAAKHNISVYSIQNGIRKACEAAYNSKKLMNLNIILGANACDDARPLTNSELIFFISNFMKSDSFDKNRSPKEVYEEHLSEWR